MPNPEPFPVVIVNPAFIVETVDEMDSVADVRIAAAALIFFARFVVNCQVLFGHDAIKSAFARKAEEILRGLYLGEIYLESLFDHLAAEKARCEKEAAAQKEEEAEQRRYLRGNCLGAEVRFPYAPELPGPISD